MQPTRTTLIFHEQHFAMQVDQSVADIMHCRLTQSAGFQLFLIAQQAVSPLLNLCLRVKLRLEPINIAVIRIQRILLCPLDIITQHIA